MRDLAAFQRIPYIDRGREWTGADCWGLHRLYVWDRRRFWLPLFDWIHAADFAERRDAVAQGQAAPAWREIERGDTRVCDLVLMDTMIDGRLEPLHVGTVVEGGRVMNTKRDTGVMIVPFDHLSVRRRLRSFWRYEPAHSVH